MSADTKPTPRVRAFVEWTVRRGRLLWTIALLLAIPATIRTVSMYAHLRSELEELLPRDAPSVRALDEMRTRMPGLQFLGVVVQPSDPGDLPSAERFVDDLAARVRSYPPELVRDVRTGNATERDFLEKHAALYVDLSDLQEVRRRLETRRDYDVAKETGNLLDEDSSPPPLDISDIEKKYADKTSGEKSDHLSSRELGLTMFFVEAGGFTTGAEKSRALLSRVKADATALDISKYGRGMRVGFASDVAINVEELDALEEDLSVSSVVVLVAEITVIFLYYRWWKSIVVLIPPLLLATVYAFGLASLPPARITELNSSTAFLGSIIVGNGINVGLILLARYREARLNGATADEALVIGVWGARAGTLAAAVAASASYASLVVTQFRGFRQFGVIGGFGMLASWGTAFVLMPPLLRWVDTDKDVSTAARSSHGSIMRIFVRAVERAAVPIVIGAATLGVLSAVEVSRFDSSQLEHDFNKLRRADTWTNGAGYWSRKMDSLLGHYLTPTVILCDTENQARAAEAASRQSMDDGALKPFVARIVGGDDVLPLDQGAKIAEAAQIRDDLTPKIRSLITPEKLDKLDRLLGDENLKVITAPDLPRGLTTGLREKDGSLGKSLLVYPRPSDALWQAGAIHTFVATLRGLAASDAHEPARAGRVAGSIPLSDDIIASIAHDAPIASAVSFLAVVLVVIVVVRAARASIYVLGSLMLGVLWLGGAVMALHIKINFANFIAFPITFGIGVDYAVNVMNRYVQDGERDISGAVRSTGGAVALCSMTTVIGYSSLLLAKNRALFLFGLVAVTGEAACLTAAIIALPAALVLARNLHERLP
jgi:predicted RND superfamily exporter protein